MENTNTTAAHFQTTIPPTPNDTHVTGKTIIIKGGRSGLVFEGARQFLLLGASRIILACRSAKRGQEAVSTLKADHQIAKTNLAAIIEAFELDLDDYQSGPRNSGHEQTMQVNCYTRILICLEIPPLLKATAVIRGSPTGITFVGSLTHSGQESLSKTLIPPSEPILDFFDNVSKYNRFTRYADGKLAVNVYIRRFATLAPSEVITGLDKNLPAPLRLVMELGGRTLVHAAVAASAETNGKFLRNNKIDP
ncbi:hypothetical protein B0T18DRAFT_436004 [Schizothecium vesticola]|uniref:NAD(P)-binding protein n=1 Tax=Schizothecium vesticola TaxID=314040 RepID=A0AA40F5V3_9PEZI|nr:hypothetical protein B0T18DRAFT_436004 [Schizothecium vesticola]